MQKRKTLVVIGAGASGLAAAVTAKKESINKNIPLDVIIIEQNDRIGKKLSATGNGRCNLSNKNMSEKHYNNSAKQLDNTFFNKDSIIRLKSFFENIGIVLKSDNEGRLYPYTFNTLSVVKCFEYAINNLGIEVIYNFKVSSILKYKNGFLIEDLNGKKKFADKIIVATGGAAAPHLGSNDSGYKLLEDVGHSIIPISSALVPVKIKNYQSNLKGVRWNCYVKLLENDKIIYENSGEVQFTEYGLSGIVIMQLSRYINESKNYTVLLDLMPEYSIAKINDILSKNITLLGFSSQILTGLINLKLGDFIFSKINLCEKLYVNKLSEIIKNLEFIVLKKMSFDKAQITKGGIKLNEFNPKTLESLIQKSIFAAGEVLNIDGDCGGYNLHFAFLSGITAGENIF